jgi:poly-gamma-glutamate capsule biosynthesis protein CapA/YwtB (metallophosphatase superfamily)
MRTALFALFSLALSSLPGSASGLDVEATPEMWPVWERLAAAHPLPRSFQPRRIDPGATPSGDRLIFGLGAAADARVVDRIALAPVGRLWDVGRVVSPDDIRAGRIRVEPLESVTLPDIALPVEGKYPDEPGYPLRADVSLAFQGTDPILRAWCESFPAPESPTPAKITWVGAVGDIMPARGVDGVLLGREGARRVFGDTLPVLAAPSLLLGNLEAAAATEGTEERKTYRFRFDPAALGVLKTAGFGYLSVANNHTFDYGTTGFLDTLEALSRWGIGTSGAGRDEQDAERPFAASYGSTEIRILSFGAYPVDRTGFDGRKTARAGTGRPGTLWLDGAGLEAAARGFSRRSFNIAIVHGGEEWSSRPVPEQRHLYRELIRAGADLVVGSHPHVLQGLEAFEGGLICYSLGNFLFPGMEGTRGGQDSLVLEVGIVRNTLRCIRLFPVRLEGRTVRLAPAHGILETVRGLTRELDDGG